ncbi:MAG: hypothetical protein KZQ88_07015 [Candidatus Thiodiazotropha sp. (ex Dulcina madagascariensis)]|nr:hypothetical protein [Candidatus Thiodiazotropha sp. (ex Dulcina madagascariensis)]MCU7925466.1 hypothetical protein [Candidatus Thiodiazotropha sp. (ex Dulcina madagascariensis)]
MKHLIPIVAVSIILAATTFSTSASNAQEIIEPTQEAAKVDIKTNTGEQSTIARYCPPFC